MLSTNLEISHPSKADDWTSAVYDLWPFMALVLNTHLGTHARTHNIYKHTHTLQRSQRQDFQWRISVSRAISVLDHLQLFTNWREVRDPHLQFMTYPTAGEDCSWTSVQYDGWLYISHHSQMKWHHTCSSDTMMLWCCILYMHGHVVFKSLKTCQYFLHTVDEGLVLGLPPTLHPPSALQSENNGVFVNWQHLHAVCGSHRRPRLADTT